jgi:hypothetical protein
MAKKILKWRCRFLKCGFDQNWVYADDVEAKKLLICMNCGIGTVPKEPVSKSGSWLPCIELKGLNLRLPNGSPGQDWVDGNGKTFSLEDYIRLHQVHPERFYYFSHPSYKRPEDLIPEPIPQDAQVGADPAPQENITSADLKVQDAQKKVEGFRDGKKINEMDYIKKLRYLEKLREWKNSGLINDEDLDAQINKTLNIGGK